MNYAYIDENNDLIALDTNDKNLSLAYVQAICPTVVTKIDNVADGLCHKYSDSDIISMKVARAFYKKTSGDGTDISHWVHTQDQRNYGSA